MNDPDHDLLLEVARDVKALDRLVHSEFEARDDAIQLLASTITESSQRQNRLFMAAIAVVGLVVTVALLFQH